jgi:hypothetical protein
MQNAVNSAKTRWNAANYTQIKAYVAPEIASAFKAVCADAGISMNSVLSQFMIDYCDKQAIGKSSKKTEPDFLSTKSKRRKKHEELLSQYIKLRDAQELANGNVPENFRETENFEEAEETVRMMDEAIEILEGIY